MSVESSEIPRTEEAEASFVNIAAYKFTRLGQLPELRQRIREFVQPTEIRGTVLLSPEGINLFVAGRRAEIDAFRMELESVPEIGAMTVKESLSDTVPFRRMLVKIKREIIAFGVDGIDPLDYTSNRISPTTLRQWLDEQRDVTLLDVRNDYEVRLGTFSDAKAIGVNHFRDLPEAVGDLPDELKAKPMVMFCTGGVRCEKAGPYLEQMGFQDVYQLDGGILQYFEDCGNAHYDGDCFVFDHRVAVDPHLEETDAILCFACRSPLTSEDQQSEHYVLNQQCPYCHQSVAERLRARVDSRHESLQTVVSPLPGSKPYENRRFVNIPADAAGQIAIDFVDNAFPFAGRAAWESRFANGLVRRQGVPISSDTTLRPGDRIENIFPDTTEPAVETDIEILYEDEFIVVVRKPAPLPMHPCGRFNRNSLVAILDEVYRPQKLRIAHRLDSNTTGIVVLSRSKSAAGFIQPQFEAGNVQKQYAALLWGNPAWESHTCVAAIGNKPGYAGARMVVDQGGMSAETHFEVLRRFGETTLVMARPITGRTNQIRVHAWHLGFPVCGDPTYLKTGLQGDRQTLEVGDPPMCLHAQALELDHPGGWRARFEACLPDWSAWLP